MNLNEYKGLFLFKSSSTSSHSFIPKTVKLEEDDDLHVYIFVIANIQSFTSQIFGVVGPLGENLDFLVCWDLTFKQILITKPKKSSSAQSEL